MKLIVHEEILSPHTNIFCTLVDSRWKHFLLCNHLLLHRFYLFNHWEWWKMQITEEMLAKDNEAQFRWGISLISSWKFMFIFSIYHQQHYHYHAQMEKIYAQLKMLLPIKNFLPAHCPFSKLVFHGYPKPMKHENSFIDLLKATINTWTAGWRWWWSDPDCRELGGVVAWCCLAGAGHRYWWCQHCFTRPTSAATAATALVYTQTLTSFLITNCETGSFWPGYYVPWS